MENITTPAKQSHKENLAGEASRFGRSQDSLLWIERKKLIKMATVLRADPDLRLDWLEHLTVMTMDELLVASYFLRSFSSPKQRLVLRTTVASGPDAALPSVRSLWPMAGPMEAEVTERFGIRFVTEAESE